MSRARERGKGGSLNAQCGLYLGCVVASGNLSDRRPPPVPVLPLEGICSPWSSVHWRTQGVTLVITKAPLKRTIAWISLTLIEMLPSRYARLWLNLATSVNVRNFDNFVRSYNGQRTELGIVVSRVGTRRRPEPVSHVRKIQTIC